MTTKKTRRKLKTKAKAKSIEGKKARAGSPGFFVSVMVTD
jgi:hypothetical protein